MDRFISQPIDQQPTEVILSITLALTTQIRDAILESKIYKVECTSVGEKVLCLSEILRLFIYVDVSTPFYERPTRRIFTNVIVNLKRTLTLVHKCRYQTIINCFVSLVDYADFEKLSNLIDESIGDMKWLRSIYDAREGIIFTLPPIASSDPILAWIWSCIASIHTRSLTLKIEVACQLCSLARDSNRNKKMIVEEGGIAPLLKLLQDLRGMGECVAYDQLRDLIAQAIDHLNMFGY